jgi:hypothetical protein
VTRALIIVGALAATAQASPTIEVRAIAGQQLPDELGQELRIYLAGTAEVVVGPPLHGASLQARVREVSGATAELVTWLEQAPATSGGGYVVVVVGKRDGRAVVDIGEVPASDASGRLLALRVGAFLDETLTTGVGERALGAGPAPRPARWWTADVGAGFASQFAQGKLAAAIGVRVDRLEVEAGLAVRASLPSSTGASPSLELSELRAGGVGRIALPLGAFRVGTALAIDVDRVNAAGIAVGGARAEITRYTPVVRLVAEGDWRWSRGIALRLAAGAERALQVQRFLVEGERLGSVGVVGAVVEGSVVVVVD